MVKNKAFPDSARLCQTLCTPIWSFFLSLPRRLGPIKASLTCLLSLSPTLFILRVPPGSCRGWTPALPDPGIKPGSSALQADSLPAELQGKPLVGTGKQKKDADETVRPKTKCRQSWESGFSKTKAQQGELLWTETSYALQLLGTQLCSSGSRCSRGTLPPSSAQVIDSLLHSCCLLH